MSTIEFEIHSNKSDDVNISLDKNNHSVDYLKKVISKKLKIKNQEQISSITLNYDGKEIIIDDDMAVKILFDKVEKNIFKNKLYIKYNDKVQTKNDNEEILKPKNLPKKNFEDVIDYLLINMKETLMNEMKEKINEDKMIYRGHKCNNCGNNIIGHLYQCSECPQEDNSFYLLCNKCIEKNLKKPFHDHKFYIL
jgi:hypothetical protein